MGTVGRQLAALADSAVLLQLFQIPIGTGGNGHLGRERDLIPLGKSLRSGGRRL
jgi:hypothetical protein